MATRHPAANRERAAEHLPKRMDRPALPHSFPTTIDAEWQKVWGGVAGNGTFTSHYFSWADSDPGNPTQTYTPIVDSVTTWASQIIFAVDCAACKPNRFRVRQLVDRTGHLLNNPLPTDTDYVDSVGVWSQINGSFSDFRWTKVHVRGLGLTAPANANAFSAVTLTAQPHGHAPPGAQYVWDFGDSTTATFVDDSTATHSYQAQNVGAGSTQCALGLSRLVTVELRDAKGNRLASASRCIFQRLAVRLAPASGLAGFSQTLAVNGGGNQAAAGFQWTFGDGTPPVVVQGDTLVTHTFARPGNYKVRVTGWDINNVPDTTAFTPVQTFDRILPGEWRITSFTLVSSSPTVPTYFPTWNHAFDDSLTFYLQRVEHTPTDGMIFFPDDSLWRERAVYFQVAPPGAGASATYWVPRSQVWLVARDASVQFSHFTDTGTLTNGTVDGLGYTTNYGASFLHSITVTKSGQTMTGTLRFALYGTTAQRTYQFTAQLVP
ncbi:MAG: PKD domain-containing protein [Gemmatimonadaceae bacterium]